MKNKFSVIGTASLNLAEFASVAEGKDLEINVPLSLLGAQAEHNPSLYVSAFSFSVLHFHVLCLCIQYAVCAKLNLVSAL